MTFTCWSCHAFFVCDDASLYSPCDRFVYEPGSDEKEARLECLLDGLVSRIPDNQEG